MNRRYLIGARRLSPKLLSKIAVVCFAGVIAVCLLAGVLFVYFAKDLPQPGKVVRHEGFATKIYDRNGELLYDVFNTQKRSPVSFDQIPEHLKNATIAVEDKNFYKHGGFDPTGIFRAIFNIVVHQRLQGGSTLTQQLVKNVLLTQQRTLPRKIKEFILAVQIENKYSKNEILQMYFNESPYGGMIWGVGEAAENYFDKPVADLNLVESVILAGIPQRPSYFSPFGSTPKAYVGRAEHVLARMRVDGYITPEQEKEAIDQLDNVKFAEEGSSFKAPHFVMYVKQLLEDEYGQSVVEEGGLRVHTTLDLKLQEAAQNIVAEEIKKVESIKITNGAAIVIDPATGGILAMVGSKDYDAPDYDGKVNVTLSLRQPGSSIKPVVYASALKKGYTASTMIMDTPVVFPVISQPDYKPVNYDGKFHGALQVRYALGNSINVTAVKMLATIGLKEVLSTAYEMGITTLEPSGENLKRFGLSVALGGGEVKLLEMATAYSAFANTGFKVEPTAILKVEDRNGKVLEEQKPLPGKRVLDPAEAFIISDILSDNKARAMTFGERSALVIPDRIVAVKTGTTNDRRDNWTVGWTPQMVVGVWVGNNDNSAMKSVTSGISGASPIWRRIIIEALKGKPAVSFTIPENVVTAEVDTVSGYRSHDGFGSRPEYFVKGTEPLSDDPVHVKMKICRDQNKLASIAQVARGEYEEKEFFVMRENDPVSTDGKNRWQEGIDSWISALGDWRYYPPTEYCGSNDEVVVSIQEPGNQQQLDNDEVKVRAEVISGAKVTVVEFFVDGQKREEVSSRPFEKIFTLSRGTHIIKVKATNEQGKSAENEVKIGIQVPWDWTEPTPTPTSLPTPTPS